MDAMHASVDIAVHLMTAALWFHLCRRFRRYLLHLARRRRSRRLGCHRERDAG